MDLQKIFDNMEFDSGESLHYNSKVLVIDALNTFMRSYAAIPTMDDDGNHIGGMAGFLKSIGLAIRTFKPTRVILVFDGKGGSQRRRKIYKDYKSNRKPPTRLNRSYDMTTDQEEAENMKFQLVSLVQMVECLPVVSMALDNIEADDAIAYLSELVTQANGKTIIYSTDKNFLQMVNNNVTVYNPVKKKNFTPESILEEYGVHPDNFVAFRALMGDKSDNITGIRGAGQKTILKYLPEFSNPEISIDVDFIKGKYEDVKKKPKLIETIIENEDIYDRNIQLMNLRDVDISVDAKMKIRDKFLQKCPQLDKLSLTKLMAKTRIISAIPNYNEWITQSFSTLTRYAR